MLRYGISSLLLLGAALIGIFYLKPAWDQFRQIRSETDHVRALSAEYDDLIQNRDSLIAKLNLVSKDDLRRAEAMIPQGPQSLEYLIALQQLAQESGVGLTFTKADISPPAAAASQTSGQAGATTQQPNAGATTPAAGRTPQMLNPGSQPATQKPAVAIKDLPVGIEVTGSYDTIKQFVGRLERFGRLTDISTLKVNAQSNPFTFSINLITHYQ